MQECICCKIAKGRGEGYQKIVVELEGGWVLNHFDGGKTYLGQLVLGTKCHRIDWGDISLKEATTLGINIQRINHSLRQYWINNYPDDIVELVHIAYLNETPYIHRHTHLLNKAQFLGESHVHMHLLTRTRKMGEAMGYCAEKIDWHLLDYIDRFPNEYKVLGKDDNQVKGLMNSLNNSLGYNHN